MINLVDEIKKILAQLDPEFKVLNIVVDKVFVCDTTKWTTISKIVKDSNGLLYKVIDISVNNWVQLEPYGHPVLFNDTVVIVNPVYFFHGTPISVNNEYKKFETDTSDKTPFMWLLSPTDTNQLPADTSLGGSFKVKSFFFDWYDKQEWIKNDDHNEYVIKPMQNLAEEFENIINDDPTYVDLRDFSTIDRARFGVLSSNKGNTKKIIDEYISGVDTKFTLEPYSFVNCKC